MVIVCISVIAIVFAMFFLRRLADRCKEADGVIATIHCPEKLEPCLEEDYVLNDAFIGGNDLCTISEAAAELGVVESTVYRMIKAGKLLYIPATPTMVIRRKNGKLLKDS